MERMSVPTAKTQRERSYPSREGKRSVTAFLDHGLWLDLNKLSIAHAERTGDRRSVQSLVEEAATDLISKYRKKGWL
jgi:hypothetical protein